MLAIIQSMSQEKYKNSRQAKNAFLATEEQFKAREARDAHTLELLNGGAGKAAKEKSKQDHKKAAQYVGALAGMAVAVVSAGEGIDRILADDRPAPITAEAPASEPTRITVTDRSGKTQTVRVTIPENGTVSGYVSNHTDRNHNEVLSEIAELNPHIEDLGKVDAGQGILVVDRDPASPGEQL